jgi:hypothetical protein
MKNLSAVMLLLLSGTVASATIVITPGPGNFPNDENVLFQADDTGNPLVAITNQTDMQVSFSSTETATLLAPSNGQARIEAQGSTDLADLTIDLVDPSLFFTTAIFNINATSDTSIGLAVNWSCLAGQTCAGGASGSFFDTYDIDGSGQNFFRIQAIDNQVIDSVRFETQGLAAVVQDVRQVRLGGFTALDGPGGDPVIPEPMTMSLFGGGLLALGFYRKYAKT